MHALHTEGGRKARSARTIPIPFLAALASCLLWLLPSGRGATNSRAAHAPQAAPPDAVLLLHKQLTGLLREGRPDQALPLARRALDLHEQASGKDHPDTLPSLRQLGAAYRDLDDYGSAESVIQRALAICENSAGSPKNDLPDILSELADVYLRWGFTDKGVALLVRARGAAAQTFGPHHPQTAKAEHALATVSSDVAANYELAESSFRRALETREQLLGPENTDTIASMRGLARLYIKKRDYAQAEALLKRALAACQKVLGPEDPQTAACLADMGLLCQRAGNRNGALLHHQNALSIREKTLGPDHPDTLSSLRSLAYVSHQIGGPSKAAPLFERILASRGKANVGDEPLSEAKTSAATAFSLGEGRQDAQVLTGVRKATEAIEKHLAAGCPDAVRRHLSVMPECTTMTEYLAARQGRPAGAASESVASPPDPADVARAAHVLAHLYHALAVHKIRRDGSADIGRFFVLGSNQCAETPFQESLALQERIRGPEDRTTREYRACRAAWLAAKDALWHEAQRHDDLAKALHQDGKDEEALAAAQRALRIRKHLLNQYDMTFLGKTTDLLLELYRASGALLEEEEVLQLKTMQNRSHGVYSQWLALSQRALAVREELFGSSHRYAADSAVSLAEAYAATGDHAKAEEHYRRALLVFEQSSHPDDVELANALLLLARNYMAKADYARAEPLFQRALALCEKQLGPDSIGTATILKSTAELYATLGDYSRAEKLGLKVVAILEQKLYLGPIQPRTGDALRQLAHIYSLAGAPLKAEQTLKRALSISARNFGPDSTNPYTADVLSDLGAVYQEIGDSVSAEDAYRRALRIREKTLGPTHADTATSLSSLATLYLAMGDAAKAQPLYQRALSVHERTLGPQHPRTAGCLAHLALLSMDTGRIGEALDFALRAERAEEGLLANILSFTSERQRMQFQKTVDPYRLLATLGRGPELAQTVLRRKGVVLDSLLEDRLAAEASGDPRQRARVDQLRASKQRLTQLLLETPRDFSDSALRQRESERDALATQVEELEAALAREMTGIGRARRALTVTLAQVQKALARDQVLLEFICYSHHLGRNRWENRYGSLIIPPQGDPIWIALGAADAIERNVRRYQQLVRSTSSEATLSVALQALHQQLWVPIERHFSKDIRTVIISPDGLLNFVSFATLLAPGGRLLGEQFSIRYASSGRDLLRETKPVPSLTLSAFSNPDFGGGPATSAGESSAQSGYSVALRALDMRDFRGVTLPPLPGTARECAALETEAQRAGWNPTVFSGPEATEARLSLLRSPRVLHLATHGFFLAETGRETGLAEGQRGIGGMKPLHPDSQAQDPGGSFLPPALNNPMHRSGLALVGAQRTLDAWAAGNVPPTANDGIVTAEEVGGLKLEGTWLVVLSACDTGAGEARAGEGVMGLRRGFIQAGAHNLLMTLWPVADEETAKLMLDFYAAAQRTGNAPQALSDVQSHWFQRLRKEHGLQAAVCLAGPFIMNSQGKVP